MEGVLAHVVERLTDPEVLFGLSVRFFGVFIVLGIVMIAIYLIGRVFVEIEKAQEPGASPDAPEGSSAAGSVEGEILTTPPVSTETPSEQVGAALSPSPVPDEAVVAVAMALAMVPGEVAVAVTLAMDQASQETVSVPFGADRASPPAAKGEPGSAWKLLGRQEALHRRTSLTRHIPPKGK